jgi:hypothetical protein
MNGLIAGRDQADARRERYPMGIRKRLTSSLVLTGATTALVIGVAAGVALAVTTAPEIDVSPAGKITASAGKTTLTDTKTGAVLTCASSSSSGTINAEADPTVGTITALTFSNCTGPLGLTFMVTNSNFPWKLTASAFSSSTGVTTGKISGIKSLLSGPSCSANVAGTTATTPGTVKVTYTNSSGVLKVLTTGGTLHVWNVSGCAGLINSGDPTTFSGSYTISPKQTVKPT